MNKKAWLSKLQAHDINKGFLYGKDNPDDSFHIPAREVSKNYECVLRWQKHVLTVAGDDDTLGIAPMQWDVLMNSEDSNTIVNITLFGTQSKYRAQYTKYTRIAKWLQDIGLIYIVDYLGGNLLDPKDGLPLGLKGCVFAYTPIGLKLVRIRLGLETNTTFALYKDTVGSVGDVSHDT